MAITVKMLKLADFRFSDRAIMKKVGEFFLRLSRERIESGVGSDGKPMHTRSKDPNAAGTYSQMWSDIRQWGSRPPKISTKKGAEYVRFKKGTLTPMRTRR